MKTILIPFDFSGNGRRALQYASNLFAGQQLTFIFLYVHDPAFRSTDLELAALTNRLYAEPRKKMRTEIDVLVKRHRLASSAFEIYVEYGDWISKVVQYILLKKVDYLVMGKSRATWVDKLLGNKVSAAVRKSPCPVVVVPEELQPKKPQKIALAVDLELIMTDEWLILLRSLAERCRAEVSIWSLINRKEETIEVLQSRRLERIFGDWLGAFTFFQADGTKNTIPSCIVKEGIDLLVTPYPEGSVFARSSHRRTVRELALNAEVPVATMPIQQSSYTWETPQWSSFYNG